VDRGDLDDLRGGIGDFLAVTIFLAFDGGAIGGGILRYRADGSDEYDFAESRAGSVTRADHGGLRDDVYGSAADRVAHCGRSGETDWGALSVGGVWDFMFFGEHGFYFSSGDAFAAAAGGAGDGLRGIRAIEPGGFGERCVSGRGKPHPCRVDLVEDGIDFGALRGQGADGIGGGGVGG